MERTNFIQIVGKLKQTVFRFPAPLICALLAVVCIIVSNNLPHTQQYSILQDNLVRIALESIAGISLFYSFHIFSETNKLDIAKRAGLILLGICILGLHFYSIPQDVYNFSTNYTLRYFIIIVCFHLVISFSLYFKEKDADAFWHYNEYLFVQFLTAFLFSSLLFIGIAGATWAVDVLFGHDIPDKYYVGFFAIIFLLFHTFYVLYKLPTDALFFEKKQKYQSGLLVFLQYVLLPIIALYGLILALYFIKIIFGNTMPKGWVVFPILIFSGLGILTYILAYPLRDGNNGVIRFFCKNYFFILLPFLTLYFNSITKRIFSYGLTENRYIIFAIGIWLLFVSLFTILSKKNKIIIFPISLCLLLTLISFGPWGMYKASAFNQFYRLKKILHRNNLLQNGKIINNPNTLQLSEYKVDEIDSKTIISIIDYLYKHNEIDRLKTILNQEEIAKIEEFKKVGFSEKNVGGILGINGIAFDNKKEISTFFTCNNVETGLNLKPLQTTGFNNILQFTANDIVENNDEPIPQDSNNYFGNLQNNTLVLLNKKDTILQINLEPLTQKMDKNISSTNADSTLLDNTISRISLPYRQFYFPKDSMVQHFANAILYVDEIKCKKTKTQTKAINMNGYIVF